MRDEDKPFVCVRTRWGMNIRPRNAAGWITLGWWLLPLLLLTLGHAAFLAHWREGQATATATLLYGAIVLLWAWLMIRWMLARSAVIRRDR